LHRIGALPSSPTAGIDGRQTGVCAGYEFIWRPVSVLLEMEIFTVSDDQKITYEELMQIVELIKSSAQFSEFRLKVGDIELDLRRGADTSRTAPVGPSITPSSPIGPTPSSVPIATSAMRQEEVGATTQRHGHVGGGELVTESEGLVRPEGPQRATPAVYPPGSHLIRSPMVGTFFRAPEPGARSFVEVGQQVRPDTTVSIIEVMKLMNSIPAGAAGIVTHILVGDSEPVEYGQVLMVIEPQ